MKKTIKLLIIYNLSFIIYHSLNAQNISINGTGAVADASAILDVSSPSLGLLVPRVALTSIAAAAPVTSPATSLLVYNTATANSGTLAVSPGYYYWDGTKWVRFAYSASGSSSTAWDLLGNAGTNSTTHFLGTTDAQDLVFRTNNLEAARINTLGNFGIGTNNPQAVLDVKRNAFANVRVTSETAFSGFESITYSGGNPYFLGIRASGTPTAIAYPLVGNTLSAFLGRDAIDYSVLLAHGGAGVWMYANENFSAANKGTYMSFHTTPNGTNIPLEMARIDHNGYVGIGTTTPSSKLNIFQSVCDNCDVAQVEVSGVNAKLNLRSTGASNDALINFFRSNTKIWDVGMQNSLTDSNFTVKSVFYNNIISAKPNGNVGIGTFGPLTKLQVNGSIFLSNASGTIKGLTFEHPVIEKGSYTGANATGDFYYYGLSEGLQESATTPNVNLSGFAGLNFFTSGMNRMHINSNGNIGIGTTTPLALLHLNSNTQTNLRIDGNSTSSTDASIELRSNASGGARGAGLIMTDVLANNSWYAGRPYSAGSVNSNDAFTINRLTAPSFYNESAVLVDGFGNPTATQNFFTIKNNGNVGIGTGTTTLTEKLVVTGKILATNGFTTSNAALVYRNNTDYLFLGAQSGSSVNGGAISLFGSTNNNALFPNPGGIDLTVVGSSPALRILSNGNVGIGIVTPTVKLEVNGNVKATGFISTINGTGAYKYNTTLDMTVPDYVFESYYDKNTINNPTYKLMPLNEVEAFVKKNKHLPRVPSREELQKEKGINLQGLTMVNLEKTEENTLYILELKKQNDLQQQQIDLLKKEIEALKKK